MGGCSSVRKSQSAGPLSAWTTKGANVILPPILGCITPAEGRHGLRAKLFFAVLFQMRFAGVIRMITGVRGMAPSRVGMMCGFLMMPAIVMFGGFTMMARSLSVVF
jgi:hypothetical protein